MTSGEEVRDSPSFDSPVASIGPDVNIPSSAAFSPPSQVEPNNGTAADGPPKAVQDVIYSDIGINTLLTRLKQSIASARDFAGFLKKRSVLEEEQATGVKRLARSQLDSMRRADVRGGSYAQQLAEVFRLHETMGDNGVQFALSLHQMHEDLTELSNNMERGRKQWKHEGLDAEKKASDAEQAMQKAKARYDGLAEDYDRARTGDSKGGRRIGLKGPKSAEQYENDLLRKTQAADADYEEKVRQAKIQREYLINTSRPDAVRALQQLIRECDSGLRLQLQKYGNGLTVNPVGDGQNGQTMRRSMRDTVVGIDNDGDFNSFVSSHSGRVSVPSEIVYEKHGSFASKQQQPAAPPSLSINTTAGQASYTQSPMQIDPQPVSFNNQAAAHQSPAPLNNNQPAYQSPASLNNQTAAYQSPAPFNNNQTAAYQSPAPYYDGYTGAPSSSHQYPTTRAAEQTSGITAPSLPPSTMMMQSAFPTSPSAPLASPFASVTAAAPPSSEREADQTILPVFGTPLQELYTRTGSAVPSVVQACIQAIDHFGLDTEGIYRLSGNNSHVSFLRSAFDTLPPSALQLDLRNPGNFFHDVNSVATLLKQFFRELPDPLFTNGMREGFLRAAGLEPEDARRDALHQLVNDLPDPNYATLRALVLHLNRVMGNEGRTRMGAGNLAVCFAPSLMGTPNTGAQISDATLQARVLDTILVNAGAIFDDD